jgi:hypothetical protein
LIYEVNEANEKLIYIGSSGQRDKDGNLKNRNGGMRDRLINGYHPNQFGELKRIKRHIAFPNQMRKENMRGLKIYWFVTYDNNNKDFPTDVETILRSKYLLKFKALPKWHSK